MDDSKVATLGWGRFILQFITVTLVFLAASAPAVIMFGMTSPGLLGSVAGSMAAALLVCWFWLRKDGAVAQAWDMDKPAIGWGRTLAVGALGAGLIIAWFQVGTLLTRRLGLGAPEVAAVLDFVTESPASLLLWIVVVAWFTAGLGEELLYRGFLMDRLNRLPGLAGKMWLVIFIQAVLFGISHGYQSLAGVLITGVVGFGLGYLRVHSGGNLWACVIAHAMVDTLMMGTAYAGKMGLLPVAG